MREILLLIDLFSYFLCYSFDSFLFCFFFFMDLKVITWNCRGLSTSSTMDRIQDFMKTSKPDFNCLVETKTIIPRIHRFCTNLNRCWDWAAIPSNGFFGGIIIFWNRSICFITPVAVNRSALHLVVSSNDNSWILTSIYNS